MKWPCIYISQVSMHYIFRVKVCHLSGWWNKKSLTFQFLTNWLSWPNMIHELFVVLCFVHENKVIFKDSVNGKIEFPCVCIKYFIGGLTFPHALSLIVAILSYSTVTINAFQTILCFSKILFLRINVLNLAERFIYMLFLSHFCWQFLCSAKKCQNIRNKKKFVSN